MVRKAKRVAAAVLAAITALTPVLGHVPVQAGADGGDVPESGIVREQAMEPASGEIRVRVGEGGTVSVSINGVTKAFSAEGGTVTESKDGGVQEAAAVDETGAALAFTANEGEVAHVEVSPAGGYEVARYAVESDSGAVTDEADVVVSGTKTVVATFEKAVEPEATKAPEMDSTVTEPDTEPAVESKADTASESKTEDAEPKSEDAESKTDEAESKADAVESKAETAEQEADGTESKKEDADPKADATESKADDSDKKAEATESKVDGTESKADATESKADTTESKAEPADKKADATESKADGTESKADGTEPKAEPADKKADATESKADAAENETDAAESKSGKDKAGTDKKDKADVIEEESEDDGIGVAVSSALSNAVFMLRAAADANEMLLAGEKAGDSASVEFRETETVKLKYGVPVAYGIEPNGTQMYQYERKPQSRETSSTYAYCVRPDLHVAPNNTTFTTNLMERNSVWLYRIMYHSFGAPGWEAAKKYYTEYLGTFQKSGQSDDQTYYAICHVVLSYAYTLYSQKRDLGWATSDSWKKGLTDAQKVAIQNLYQTLKDPNNLPSAPSNFAVYSTRGSGYQDMLYWVIRELPPKGSFRIRKLSSNPSKTDGNSAYSLVGTKFNIYDGYELDDDGNYSYDDATLVASVTIKDDKGGTEGGLSDLIELDPGTYWAVEVKVGKGYTGTEKPTKIVVKSGQTIEQKIENSPDSGHARVKKVAKNLAAAQELGATLNGIVYRIYASEEDANAKKNHVGRNLYVGEDGYSNLSSNLPYGTYWWREVKTNDYFELSNYIGSFTIDSKHQEVTFQAEDDIAKYYVKVRKFSEDESITKKNGNYSLKGAVFGLYKTLADAKVADIDNQNDPIGILTTDEDGKSNPITVVVGTYYLKELAPSPGFLLNDEIQKVVVNSDTATVTEKGNSLVWAEVEEPFNSPYVRVVKSSSNKDVTDGNPCYSLKGATYGLYKTRKEAEDATAEDDGEPVARFVCNSEGSSNAPKVPYGTYYLKETVSGKNYKLSEDIITVVVSKDTTHITPSGNELLIVYVEDAPAMDPLHVTIKKVDGENAEPVGSLAGAQFTIKYYAAEKKTAKQLEEMTPTRKWIIETKETSAIAADATLDTEWLVAGSDKLYKNEKGETAIPVGMLVVEETKAPARYTVQDVRIVAGDGDVLGSKAILNVVKDGDVATIAAGHAFTAEDSPRRGDLEFTKVGPKEEKLAYVPFQLDYYGDDKEGSVLESHVIMTDANGFYSSQSSYAKHSYDTNGGKAGSGTWFGDIKALDDEKGALPAGHYHIQELRSTSNQGYKMISGWFSISKDGEVQTPKDGAAYHDPAVTVDTEAKDVLTGTNYAEAAGTRKFSDTVTMTGLEVGAKYRIATVLMDKGGRKPAQSGGKDVRAEKEFTADAEEMSVDVEVTIEADGLDGRDLVFFETLYMLTSEWATDGFDPTVPAASHEDYDDEKQTIHMLGISTSLKSADGSKSVAMPEADAQGNYPVSLIDAVSYSGLEAGAEYVAEGELMDKSTGKAFHDAAGNAVTATKSFTAAEGGKGVVDVKFDFTIAASDAKRLQAGGALVSFQAVKRGGEEVATHKDINDAEQTVGFPSVKTTAVDAESGTKTANADTSVRINDRVDYTGLMPGKKYTATGKLYDKATGKPVTVGGKEVTASKEFTAPALTAEDIAAGRTLVSGSVVIEFVFDGTGLEGHAVVAFEDLYEDGRKFATHADINDDDQTTYLPKVRTVLADAENGGKTLSVGHTHQLVDHVEYEMLRPNSLYLLVADLVDKADGKSVIAGKVKLAFVTGGNGPASGNVDVPVSVDVTEALVNHKLVCTETLYALGAADMAAYGNDTDGYTKAAAEGAELSDSKVVGSHADLEDADQTVGVPGVKTELKADNGTHTALAKVVTLTDIVRYTDLVPGKTYTATATLYNKKDGKPLANLEPVTVSFTAPELGEADIAAGKTLVSGEVEVPITVDLSAVAGERVVCGETIRENDVEVAVHHDLEDEDQTVDVPAFDTVLATTDGSKLVKEGEKATLVDTLSYKKLRKGDAYTVWTYAYAVDAEGNVKALGDNGLVARTALVAEAADGSIDVEFEVDTTGLGGGSIACLEKVTVGRGDAFDEAMLVGEHGGVGDEAQTVNVPVIETELTGTEGTHSAPAGIVTLTDTVTYDGLIPGKTYTATAQLYDQETGEPVPEAGPVAIEFTAPELTEADKAAGRTTVSGQVEVPITVDLSAIAGRKVVCFEDVDEDGRKVAVHHDINDKEQTVNVPKFDTLLATAEGGKLVQEGEKAKVRDVLSYWNLVKGDTYTTWAFLFVTDGKGGYEPIGDGPVAAATFTADAEDGEVEVTMDLDATGLGGRRIVCQEKVTVGGQEDGLVEARVIGTHGALDDEDQSVHVPTVETELTGVEGSHSAPAEANVTLIDTVTYTGLVPGKTYTATAQLYDQETGKALKGVDPVTVEFTAPALTEADKAAGRTTVSGEVQVPITVSLVGLAGRSVVCFEDIEHEGRKVAIHHDLNDEPQTVHIPAFATELLTANGGKLLLEGASVELVDTISYRNLVPGDTYTAWTYLYAVDEYLGTETRPVGREAGMGKDVVAATTFTAKAANGKVETSMIIDTEGLGGMRVVCAQVVTIGDAKGGLDEALVVGRHHDLSDEAQSVLVPVIGTEAVDKATGTHMAYGTESITIVDRVDYVALVPGKEYEAKGTLYDKETGKPFLVDGKEVTATRTFTAPELTAKDRKAGRTSVSGSVELEFTFDGVPALGKTIVAFENLYEDGRKVATHADIEDEDQTVYVPKVDTVLAVAGSGAKRVSCRQGTVQITDTVTYKNFVPGREYVAQATIYDRTTGKMTSVRGQTIFTAETPNGAVSVSMKIDVSGLAGHTIVCFEKVYDRESEKLVAAHEDPNDAAQSIDIYDVPQTGDVPYMTIAFIIGGVLLLAGGAFLVLALARRRKKSN